MFSCCCLALSQSCSLCLPSAGQDRELQAEVNRRRDLKVHQCFYSLSQWCFLSLRNKRGAFLILALNMTLTLVIIGISVYQCSVSNRYLMPNNGHVAYIQVSVFRNAVNNSHFMSGVLWPFCVSLSLFSMLCDFPKAMIYII